MWNENGTSKERFLDQRIRRSSINREPVLRTVTYLKSKPEKKRLPTLIKGKYPEYRTREARLASFHGWPRQMAQQDPKHLARCGFFYIGSADRVRCFCCGTTLRNWMSGDDPYIEHLTWAPECPYVISLQRPLFPAISSDWKKAGQVNSFTESQERLGAGDACTLWRGHRLHHVDRSADDDQRSNQTSFADLTRTCLYDRGDADRTRLSMYDRGDGQRILGCHRERYDQDDQPDSVSRTSVHDRAASPISPDGQKNWDDGEDDKLDQSYSTTDSHDECDHLCGESLVVSPRHERDQGGNNASVEMLNSKGEPLIEDGQTVGSERGVGQPNLEGSPLTGSRERKTRTERSKRRNSSMLQLEHLTTADNAFRCSSANSGKLSLSEGDHEDLRLVVGRVPPAMMQSPQVLAVIDMGFSRDLVKTVLQMRLVRTGRAYPSAVDLFLDAERIDQLR